MGRRTQNVIARVIAVPPKERSPQKAQFWSTLTTIIPWLLTAGALTISTCSYEKTEQWKHNDMLITTFKNFDNQFSVRFFKKIIDYEATKLPLKEGEEPVAISEYIVADALRTTNLHFDDEEVEIRDLADDYLDQLTQLYYNIKAGTLTYEEVESRLSYYLDILIEQSNKNNQKSSVTERAEFINSFNNFIHTYKYTGVEELLKHYQDQKNKELSCNCLVSVSN